VSRASRVSMTLSAHAVLVVAAALALFPFYWLVNGSLEPVSSLFKVPPNVLADPFTLGNYERLFESTQFPRWFLNSTAVAILHVVTVLPTAAMAGFAFAQYRFRGDRALFIYVIGFLMIPLQVLIVPLYIAMLRIGWTDSYVALVAPFAASPLGVFLLRQWMVKIPPELLDAARVDGAGEWRIFTRIVCPLSGPALATVAILEFLWSWDSFLWPAVVLGDTGQYTLPVGIATFVTQGGAGDRLYGPLTAASVISIVPVIVAFVFLRRRFVAGLAATGVNG
jgi:ABC-type glycerol-3-phosphate transport system permease component